MWQTCTVDVHDNPSHQERVKSCTHVMKDEETKKKRKKRAERKRIYIENKDERLYKEKIQ